MKVLWGFVTALKFMCLQRELTTVCTASGWPKRVVQDTTFFLDFTKPKSFFTSLLLSEESEDSGTEQNRMDDACLRQSKNEFRAASLLRVSQSGFPIRVMKRLFAFVPFISPQWLEVGREGETWDSWAATLFDDQRIFGRKRLGYPDTKWGSGCLDPGNRLGPVYPKTETYSENQELKGIPVEWETGHATTVKELLINRLHVRYHVITNLAIST